MLLFCMEATKGWNNSWTTFYISLSHSSVVLMVSTELCKLLVQSLLAIGVDIGQLVVCHISASSCRWHILVHRHYIYVISLGQSNWWTLIVSSHWASNLQSSVSGLKRRRKSWNVHWMKRLSNLSIGCISLSPVKISVSLTLLFESMHTLVILSPMYCICTHSLQCHFQQKKETS